MTDDGIFDAAVAATYDERHGGSGTDDVRKAVQLLKELANGGDVLEFAIGTGRVALPLQDMGVKVGGIELSRAMVDQLRRKESGQPIDVAIGDMSSTRVDGAFSLVYLVYNTIDNLITQDAQMACFANAAAHLKTGGRFLIETLVPPIQKVPFGETKLAFECSPTHWGIDEFDVVSQTYTSHHIHLEGEHARQISVPFRYAWPAEFDLMARAAGMVLEHRWSDWDRSPFTATSHRHVSVWRRPVD